MEEALKQMYQEGLARFCSSRKELAEATIAWDEGRHAVRVRLYVDKMNGNKMTEENIRSISVADCANEAARYQNALCAFEIAKEQLEFLKKF